MACRHVLRSITPIEFRSSIGTVAIWSVCGHRARQFCWSLSNVYWTFTVEPEVSGRKHLEGDKVSRAYIPWAVSACQTAQPHEAAVASLAGHGNDSPSRRHPESPSYWGMTLHSFSLHTCRSSTAAATTKDVAVLSCCRVERTGRAIKV